MIDIAVVGATGAVGGAILSMLADSDLPLGRVYALASAASYGETALLGGKALAVGSLADFDFGQVAIAIFATPAAVSAEFAPLAVEAGAIVVDCSTQFRRDDEVPLVVSGVNSDAIATFRARGIVAVPGVAAAVLAVVVQPLHDEVGVKQINVATYQGVSSAGKPGVNALAGQAADMLSGKSATAAVFPRPMAFNLIPQVGQLGEGGHTDEETGLVDDMRRLFTDPQLDVNATCVQVPVFYGHCQVVYLETRYPLGLDQVRTLLKQSSDLVLAEGTGYATPFVDIEGDDRVFVGRLRLAQSRENGISLWLAADNLRGSAARNSIHVVKQLIEFYL